MVRRHARILSNFANHAASNDDRIDDREKDHRGDDDDELVKWRSSSVSEQEHLCSMGYTLLNSVRLRQHKSRAVRMSHVRSDSSL